MHNVPLYRKMGLNKQYYSSISSADFIGKEDKLKGSYQRPILSQLSAYANLNDESKSSIRAFDEKGYAVLSGYITDDVVEKINATIDGMVSKGELSYEYNDKLMFAIRKSPWLRSLWDAPAFKSLLDYCIQGDATLFQSINFTRGSQQKTHSDSIHMTTFPLGGLLGVWLALEDIDPDAGPLHYYPGSHRLPYYLNKDYDNQGNRFLIGRQDYSAYEAFIEGRLKDLKIKKEIFTPKKGDLLIWHANLLHGGEPHRNPAKTRKSMVLHYFDKECICYHEISQRPALMDF